MTTVSQVTDAVIRNRYEDQVSRGAAAAAAAMRDVGAAVEGTDTAVRKSTQTFEQLARKLDPVARYKQDLTRAEAEYTRAVTTATQAAERDASVQERAAAIIQGAATAREAALRRADERLSRSQQTMAAFDAAMQQTARTAEATARSIAELASPFERARQAQERVAAETQRLEQRFRPLIAINQEYRRGLEDITKAERLLGLTAKEAEVERNRLTAAYERQRAAMSGVTTSAQRVTAATQQVTASTRLSAQQLTQLSYQANDVFVGLASGQSPLMVLVQQGPQVTQALGGVRQSFSLLTSAITPFRAATVLGAVGFAAIIASAEQTEGRLVTLRNELRGFQTDYANMARSIDQSSRRQALASPGFSLSDITGAQARIAQALPTGGVGASLEELTELAKDLSRTLDQDLASASSRVARALRDPAAVARELADQRFPGMTEEVRRTIEVLQLGGDRVTAFGVLMGRVREPIRGAAEDMTAGEAAISRMEKAFASLWSTIKDGLATAGAPLVEWLSRVQQRNNGEDFIQALLRNVPAEQRGQAERDIRAQLGWAGGASTPAGAASRPAGYAYSGGATSVLDAIRFVEGSGSYNPSGGTGSFIGGYQMGQAALAAAGVYTRQQVGVTPWGGTFNIPGFPNVRTRDDFVASPGAQDAAANAYLAHLSAIIDRQGLLQNNPTIGGMPVTRDALLGVMWGAGPGDAARWLRSGGTVNPADGNGVTATQRLSWFSQGGAVPVTVVGAASAPGPGTTPSAGTNQTAIDDALRAARGLGLRSDRAEDLNATIRTLEQAQGMVERGGDAWTKLQQGIDAARAALVATDSPTQQYLRAGRQQIEVLQAQDGAAREVAEAMLGLRRAVEQERGAGAQPTAAEEAEARRQVFARLSAQYEDSSRALDRQAAAEERIAEAMRRGTAAGAAQESQERASEEVRRTAIAGTSQYGQAVADLAARYERLKQAQADRATAQQGQQQRDEIELIETETRLVTASVEVRERELAVMRARQDIVRRGGNPDSDVSRDALATAERLAAARVESERFRSSFEELQNIGERAFDRIGEAITQAFANGSMKAIDFGNIGKAVLSEVAQDAIRLGALNPLRNWLMGTNLPTLGSVAQVAGMMGGSAGSSTSGGSLGQLQSLGSLSNLGGGNGGSGILSGLGGILSTPIWQPGIGLFGSSASSLYAAGAGGYAGAGPFLSGGAGLSGSVTLGGLVAGIGGGYMIGSTLGSLVAGNSAARQTNAQIGAGAGAVAGAAIGSIIPGVGTVVGGLVGGAIGGGGGGLIGPGAGFSGGDVGIGVGPDGLLRVTGTGGKNWNAGSAQQAAQQQIDQLNAILNASGITIQGVSGYDWKGGNTIGFMGAGGSSNVFGPSEIFGRVRSGLTGGNATMQALLGQSFIQSWDDLAKTAPYAANDNANLRAALGSGGIRSVDDVASAANFIAQIFEPLTTAEEKASSWNDRIKQISDTFGSAIDTAQRFGLATDELVRRQKLATDAFNADWNLAYSGVVTGLQVRSLTAQAAVESDPLKALDLQRQAALAQFDLGARQQRQSFDASLTDLALDRWNPAEYTRLLAEQEKVLAEERIAILKQFEAQATAIEKQRAQEVAGVTANLLARSLQARAALEDDPQQALNFQRQAALVEFDYNARQQRRDLEAKLLGFGLDQQNPVQYARLLADQEKVLAEERLAILKQFKDQAEAIEKQRADQARAAVSGVITNLADYAAGLRVGEASPLSPRQRYNAAERQFNAVANSALAGDFTSAQKLSSYANSYLELARDVYGGGSGYAEAFDRVVEILNRVSSMPTDELTASAQRAIAREQTEVLVDELARLRSELRALRAEVAQGSSMPASAA